MELLINASKAKENFADNQFQNILRLSDVFWLSLQVKRSSIISNKHGTYELPHESPTSALRSLEIKKHQKNLKTSKNDSLVPSLPAKIKILLIVAKIS